MDHVLDSQLYSCKISSLLDGYIMSALILVLMLFVRRLHFFEVIIGIAEC